MGAGQNIQQHGCRDFSRSAGFVRQGGDGDGADLTVKAVVEAGNSHGPFTWGTDPHNAVHNAVVLEELAFMAFHTEAIQPGKEPMQQELLDKHYLRKHGKNAYYGQN